MRSKCEVMRSKCVNCEKNYHPKDDFCRKCDFQEAQFKLIDALMETKVAKLMGKLLTWLNRKLRKDGVG